MFRSFFLAGFECSTQVRRDGRRLDLVAATRHDRFAREDYERLRGASLLAAREGLRWHLVEPRPHEFDFSSARPIVEAARQLGVQLLWDLCHNGWPDHLDVWSPAFPERLGELAGAFALWLRDEGLPLEFVTPVNEISFLSWAGGEAGCFLPYARGRGDELKAQLVRAAIRATEAVRQAAPQARVLHTDPAIHVVAPPRRALDRPEAERSRLSQFAAFEMLAGRLRPELGGHEGHLELLGLSYYHDNQWYVGSERRIRPGHRDYRPLRDMLFEWWQRFGRPIVIAQTGIEAAARPRWLRLVCREVEAAAERGVVVEGVCLYPVLSHPAWTNDRRRHNGLWDYADVKGRRRVYEPLARELRRQAELRVARRRDELRRERAS